MIVSAYTIHLYCDHPDHISKNPQRSELAEFSDESKLECFKQARKLGWKLNLKEWTCICPKCRKKKNK